MPRPTVATLHKRLTPIFNRFIRLRDTLPLINRGGGVLVRNGLCVSCGVKKPFDQLQAGHFVPADHYIHRYDERNVNAQCVKCNRFMHGNLIGYWLGMEAKWGWQVTHKLAETRNDQRIYTVPELEELIEYYSNKVKQLEI